MSYSMRESVTWTTCRYCNGTPKYRTGWPWNRRDATCPVCVESPGYEKRVHFEPFERADPYKYKSIAEQSEHLLVMQIEREQEDGWEVVQFYTPPSPWKHEVNLYRCWMRRKAEGGR